MFGAIYGDIIGSRFEFCGTKEYDFEFNPYSKYTDDTLMTVATCKAILENPKEIEPKKLRKRGREYAIQYRKFYSLHPFAGFGSMFSEWASKRIMRKNSSYGNGGAMRVVPIGFAYDSESQVLIQAEASCYYTHNNAEAICAAQAVALAVFLARKGESKEKIKETLQEKFGYNLNRTIESIRKDYKFSSRSSYSVPPSIIAFLESNDYESAIRNAISIGGDADTQACIAGGIAYAYYKSIPEHIEEFCAGRMDTMMKDIVTEFEKIYAGDR